MWTNLKYPVVFGHRGDKAFAPENTLSSFKQAADKGADGIEFDVKLSSDGEVIVLHDKTVDRTTNGHGFASRLSLSALRSLDAGVQFPGKFPGERIPTLKEVFETVGERVYMNIELTNYYTPFDLLVLKVVELIKKHGMEKRVLFSSYFPLNLAKARRLLPEVPRGLLAFPGLMGLWSRNFGWRGEYTSLNPNLIDVNSGLVDRIHKAGKQVYTWTINSEEDIKRMIGWGVDGIITDNPELALRLLGRGRSSTAKIEAS
jgi:glycerophosphoryl diester phosphodiesterase